MSKFFKYSSVFYNLYIFTASNSLHDQTSLQLQVERTTGRGQLKGDGHKNGFVRRSRPAPVLPGPEQRQHDGGGGNGSSQSRPGQSCGTTCGRSGVRIFISRHQGTVGLVLYSM